jgi:hypothetical protein
VVGRGAPELCLAGAAYDERLGDVVATAPTLSSRSRAWWSMRSLLRSWLAGRTGSLHDWNQTSPLALSGLPVAME